MPSFNKALVMGHLGRDAETSHTTSGNAKTTFSVATSRRWKDKQSGEWKEATDWINVTAWGLSDYVLSGLQKGALVHVEGSCRTDNYEKGGEKRTYAYVNADRVLLMNGKNDGPPKSRGDMGGGELIDDSDVPF